MRKSLLVVVAASSFLMASSGGAISGPYTFGDEPYTLNWGRYQRSKRVAGSGIGQQYQYNDHCPVYVHPKAYMYPRSSRVVLRTKG
jgi:hypothetical protein